MPYDEKAIKALGTLRAFTGPGGGRFLPGEIVQAIKVLDNAGVFKDLDDQEADRRGGQTEQDQHGNSTVPDGGWEEYERSMVPVHVHFAGDVLALCGVPLPGVDNKTTDPSEATCKHCLDAVDDHVRAEEG
jgi:hypothetical protein